MRKRTCYSLLLGLLLLGLLILCKSGIIEGNTNPDAPSDSGNTNSDSGNMNSDSGNYLSNSGTMLRKSGDMNSDSGDLTPTGQRIYGLCPEGSNQKYKTDEGGANCNLPKPSYNTPTNPPTTTPTKPPPTTTPAKPPKIIPPNRKLPMPRPPPNRRAKNR